MSDTSSSIASEPPAGAPADGRQRGNGFGVASLVLGIITIIGFAIPIVNYVGIGTGVAGVVLGVVGLVVKLRPRKAALVGVILSALGLILSIVLAAVYTAGFAGAAKSLSEATVPPATPTSTSSPSPSASASADTTGAGADGASGSFTDGVVMTSKIKIQILSHRVIPVGQAGNEYGDAPLLAFDYNTTNLTDAAIDPDTAWISTFTAVQDNNPNAVNTLEVGALTDEKYLTSQTQDIKNGGTVENEIAYSLTDTTTPVKLTAKDGFFGDDLGSLTVPVQ